jgi:predicted transposase YdaD
MNLKEMLTSDLVIQMVLSLQETRIYGSVNTTTYNQQQKAEQVRMQRLQELADELDRRIPVSK